MSSAAKARTNSTNGSISGEEHHHSGGEGPEDDIESNVMPESRTRKKRKRVTQACSQCRKRKDRCNGQTPVCSRCQVLGLICHYSSEPRKRGLPTGYVRAVEVLWGLAFTQIPQSELAIRHQLKINQGLFKAQRIPGIPEKDDFAADNLQDIWRKSAVASDLELLLAGHGDLDNGREADGSGELPDLGQPSSLTDANSSWEVGGRNKRIDLVSEDALGRLIGQENTQPFSSSAPLLQQIQITKLPAKFHECIQRYFSNVHCWFPVLEKHDILRAAYLSNEGNSEEFQSGVNSGQFAALWAMLAYVCDKNPTSGAKDPNSSPRSTNSSESANRYNIARDLIAREEGSIYDIGHVQALVLLGLYKADRQEWTAAWHLVGQAVRIAIDISFGRTENIQSTQSARLKLDQRQRRVILGCFALDTLLSIHLGKLPYLSKTDLAGIGLLNVEGLEEWEPWLPHDDGSQDSKFLGSSANAPARTLSVFNAYIGLLGIFNDVVRWKWNGYIEKAQCQGFLHALETWKTSLPLHALSPLQVAEDQLPIQTSGSFPHLVNLCLTYTSLVTLIKTQPLIRHPSFTLPAEQVISLIDQGFDESKCLGMRVSIDVIANIVGLSSLASGKHVLLRAHLSELVGRARTEPASSAMPNIPRGWANLDLPETAISNNATPRWLTYSWRGHDEKSKSETPSNSLDLATDRIQDVIQQQSADYGKVMPSWLSSSMPKASRMDAQLDTSQTDSFWELQPNDFAFTVEPSYEMPINPSEDVQLALPTTHQSLREEEMESIFDDILNQDQVNRSEEMPQLMLNLGFSTESANIDLFLNN